MTSSTADVLWVPEGTRGALQSLAQASLNEWAERWIPGAQLQAPEVAALTWRAPGEMLGAPASESLLVDRPVGRSWRLALAKQLFGASHETSALVDEVVANASRSLRATLGKKFGTTEDRPEQRDMPGHWGIAVDATILGCQWSALLSVGSLRRQGLLSTPRSSPLSAWDAEEVFAGLPVPLEAQIGAVEIALQDLLNLSEGDVIVLPQPLNAAVLVSSPGSSLELSGALGATADLTRKSLRLLAPS